MYVLDAAGSGSGIPSLVSRQTVEEMRSYRILNVFPNESLLGLSTLEPITRNVSFFFFYTTYRDVFTCLVPSPGVLCSFGG
ncbi:hypothetical protein PRIPAC_92305 [Pristionchus pacificus]|uniref:Uncharacterized protein n=1 Tax=Pristionchus pacificus TaxID=54126 RepID=A0A2A6CDI6_PRIPA|nr:hypothetical protein PRIPAC_92305 [Pristionchus pacificus]|eukprot:PDM76177.1 hypothetical protein PRIPAC_39781 [Pristionchus pacificus]